MSYFENDLFPDNLLSSSPGWASHVPSDDIWKKFDIPPTPPVSPFHDQLIDEDLDLGISQDLLDVDISELMDNSDWFMPEILASECLSECSRKCEFGELRHDCMWAGRCPSEEHKKERDSPLFSVSPSEISFFPAEPVRRPRFDTLGSARVESPLPLSDSEPEEEASTEDDEPESRPTSVCNPHDRHVSGSARDVFTKVNITDHNYTHSDHSYHSQRRPPHAENLGIQTPSDSEEEIDVVSLGEVLRIQPAAAESKNVASAQCKSLRVTASPTPIKLQLKVTQLQSSGKSSLPSHPTAQVRKQLQLQLEAATSSQQQKESVSSRKRSRNDRHPSSPKKRPSRSASDSEDSCEKRSLHNNMERQRRVDLRNAFDHLRVLIPDLESTDRAAKVVILKEAARYCQQLTRFERKLRLEKDSLMQRQEALHKKLNSLQRRR